MSLISLEEALTQAKTKYGVNIKPVTTRKWIMLGVLPSKVTETGASSKGGVKGQYDSDMPIYIAVANFLKTKEKLTLLQIAEARRKAEESKKDFKAGKEIFKSFLSLKEQYIKLWLIYFAKLKAGYGIDEPVKVNYTFQLYENGEFQYKEDIKIAKLGGGKWN